MRCRWLPGTLDDMTTPVGRYQDHEPSAQHSGAWRALPTLPEVAYVLVILAIAVWGFTSGSSASTAFILLAVLLTVPMGVPVLVGYYMDFALLGLVPGANPDHSSGVTECTAGGTCHGWSTGDPAPWFIDATHVIGILALTAAAVLNVVLLRVLRTRR